MVFFPGAVALCLPLGSFFCTADVSRSFPKGHRYLGILDVCAWRGFPNAFPAKGEGPVGLCDGTKYSIERVSLRTNVISFGISYYILNHIPILSSFFFFNMWCLICVCFVVECVFDFLSLECLRFLKW